MTQSNASYPTKSVSKVALGVYWGTLLVLLTTTMCSYPVLVGCWQDNSFMIAGLKSLRHSEPALALFDPEAGELCTEHFEQSLVRRAEEEALATLSSLRWAALCHMPLDLHLDSEIEQPLYWFFAGWVTAHHKGLSEAKSFWRHDPSIARYLAGVSAHLFEIGRVDEALLFTDLAIEISPSVVRSSYPLNRTLCVYYSDQGMLEQAVPKCELAAQLGGWNRDWQLLGLVYHQTGRYKDAIAAYSRADSVVARYGQALSLRAVGDFEEAELILRELITRAPDYDKAYLALIQLYLDWGRLCDARSIVEDAFLESCEADEGSVPQQYCDILSQGGSSQCKY